MTSDAPPPRDLEAEVLLWTARLPLVPSDDLQMLTGASDDATRRALDVLDRHGWLERIEIRSAGYEYPFVGYALRAAAVPAFARAFGLDEAELRRCWPVERRDLFDRIASFEVADSVNRFLASVADDLVKEGTYRVVDLRALPRRRAADREWPPLMDGYGCVAWKYDARPFFVAWDRAAAPAKHRAARVGAWYEARGDDDWPTILIVCPADVQRRQWERAIRISAYRRDTDPLEVAFTSTKDAFGNRPTGRCWRFPDEDYDESLSSVLRPGAGLPFHRPQSPRLDLVDRGVDVRTPTLSEWATGVLASGRGSSRDRVAALRLTMERGHWTALSTLSHHPYLTTDDFLVLIGEEEEKQVTRWFADFDRYGLVGSLMEETPLR